VTTFNVDTYGQDLTFSTGIDLTGQTSLKLLVLKPTGEEVEITSGVAVSGDDADGVIGYTVTSAANLWSTDGVFKITPQVSFSGEQHESTTPASVTIYRSNQYR
jgi:hypothetical protein